MIEVAIDSSQNVSIALALDGVIFSRNNIELGRATDSEFLPCLKEFLNIHTLTINDVEGWTVGLGPGSFAGIRFALALVKGICTATHARARGVNSSYAMARSFVKAKKNSDGLIGIVQDARCNKAFLSIYHCKAGICRPSCTPAMIDLALDWPDWTECDCYCTPNEDIIKAMPSSIASRVSLIQPAEAFNLLEADESIWPWLDTPDIEPIYVRPPA